MIANSNRILWLPGDDSRNWDYESGGWAGGNRNPSGVKIDAETALRSTVVLACIRVLSTSVAGLPLHLYRRLAGGGKEIAREHPLYRILHTQPNSWQTSFEWREQMMLHLLTTGAAFDEKVYSGGSISEIVPLHPSRMKVEQIENMRLRYTYREASGGSTVYTQDAIMSVRGMSDDGVHGLSMIEMARDAIGLSRACEIHGASFFGNGARPGVILSTDQILSPEAAENTRNQWERAHRGADRAHKTAVLQGGLKVNELGGNNQEAQFLEARRFQVEEICRLWGVPPHLVGDLSRSSYSNIEQQSLDYVQNGLMPWLRRIESAIARDLLENDDEYFAEFDTRGSLRADAAGRATYYNTLWQLGVASVNEIRAWENMNPVEGGDTRFVQLNMTTLEKAAAEPEVPVVEEIITVEEPAATPADAPTVIEVLDQYRSGSLTLEGAKALLMVSFPQTPEAMIDAILAGVVMKEPEPVAEEPAPEPVAPEPEAPAPEEASQRAAPYYEGDWVTLPDGRVGLVDHVMTEGELNLGDVAMPATPDAPVALVSVWEGESFGEPVPVAVSELQTAEEPEAARAYGKPKRKPAKRAAEPSGRRLRRGFCKTGPGGGIDNSCGSGKGGGGEGADQSDAWFSSMPPEKKKVVEGWIQRDYEVIRSVQSSGRLDKPSYMSDTAWDTTQQWNEVVESAPTYDGVAYRGINPYTNTSGFRPEDYKVGDVITFSADSSATTDSQVAARFSTRPTTLDVEDFGESYAPKPGVVLKIHAKDAADIRGANKKESEVIIRRKQSYRVESIAGNEVTLRPGGES